MLSPAAPHARMVSPEQSKHPGPAPAKQYGLPSWARAYAIAAPAPPLTRTLALGGAGLPPLDELLLALGAGALFGAVGAGAGAASVVGGACAAGAESGGAVSVGVESVRGGAAAAAAAALAAAASVNRCCAAASAAASRRASSSATSCAISPFTCESSCSWRALAASTAA